MLPRLPRELWLDILQWRRCAMRMWFHDIRHQIKSCLEFPTDDSAFNDYRHLRYVFKLPMLPGVARHTWIVDYRRMELSHMFGYLSNNHLTRQVWLIDQDALDDVPALYPDSDDDVEMIDESEVSVTLPLSPSYMDEIWEFE